MCVLDPSVLKDWQTLIGAGIAFGGAWWTVAQIRRQIAQTSELAEKNRQREEAAAKAVLPLALSELMQYVADCMKLIHMYSPGQGPIPAVPATVKVPRIPEVMGILQTCARFADADIVSLIWLVLQKLQVQHTRLEGTFADRVDQQVRAHEGVERLIDAADLHAAVARLFPYGRDEEKLRGHASLKELQTAFVVNGIMPETHDILSENLKQMQ